jgi:hypothetical protein
MSQDNTFDYLALDGAETRKTLALSIEYIIGADVEGAIAEFGTKDGHTASFICGALGQFMKKYAYLPEATHRRKVHLFDSFAGLPATDCEGDKDSPHVLTRVWKQGSFKASRTPKEIRAALAPLLDESLVHIHPGWFQDTLPRLADDTRLAMMHVDCDLYSSTIQVLDQVFGRGLVAEGCVVLFDDFQCNRASLEFGERKAWREMIEKYGIAFSDAGAYGWHGQRFFVHSYARSAS